MSIDPALLEREAVIAAWREQNYESFTNTDDRRCVEMLRETGIMMLLEAPEGALLYDASETLMTSSPDESYRPFARTLGEFLGLLTQEVAPHQKPLMKTVVETLLRTLASVEPKDKRGLSYKIFANHRYFREWLES